MIYAIIFPAPPTHYPDCIILALILAIVLLLKDKKCTPYWQLSPTFVFIMLSVLIYCGYYLAGYFDGDKCNADHLIHAGIIVLALLFAANILLLAWRHLIMHYRVASVYKNGIIDARDLQLLRLELCVGSEDQIIGILMRDAYDHKQITRYRQLSGLRKRLQEKEMLAGRDVSQRDLLLYQKSFFRKHLKDDMDKDIRNFL